MRILAISTVAVIAQLLSSAVKAQNIQCDTGSVTKTYGDVEWSVYSCDDGVSLVFVSTPTSPANPFYFFLSKDKNGMNLSGEGTGSKSATDAAYADLSALTDQDRLALIAATKTAPVQTNP